MIPLLIFPVISFSVILYLFLILFGNNFLIWILAFVFTVPFNIFLLKENFKDLRKIKFQTSLLIFLLIIAFYIFAKAVVLLPLVLTIKQDNFEHVQITDVGDYYKHIFVTFAISGDGIPSQNPYYPAVKLSYYYGYYLVPAFFVKIFQIQPNFATYFFGLFITGLSLLIILTIIYRELTSFSYRLLAFLLIIFGSGIDVFAYLLIKINIFKQQLIQVITQGNETGIQLINFYKSVLFVPQHFFAAVITVAAIYYLVKIKNNPVFLGFCFAFVFSSSTVVFPTLAIWIILVFLFFKDLRILIFKSCALGFVLVVPYILTLHDRTKTIYLYNFTPYDFSGIFLVDTLISFVICYGPILLLILPLFLMSGIRFNAFYFLIIFVPVFLTWFIRSPLFNDFSLRTMIPVAIALPLFFIKILDSTKIKYVKILIVFISLITIAVGIGGFSFEYLSHFKNRQILNPRDSEVLLKIRKLPNEKLAAIDRERWVEFIPSIGFKKVLTPHLFDSYNYIAGNDGYKHSEYENLALKIFIDENSAPDLLTLINTQNENLNTLGKFFNLQDFDKLILNNQVWLKNDKNPWIEMFKTMNVSNKRLTGDFTLFDGKDLKQKLSENKIYVNEKPEIVEIRDRKVPMKKGIWFIASCKESGELKLGFEDYYDLFNTNSNRCTGRIFYLDQDEDVVVTESSTISEIYIFPVIIEKII